MMNRGPVYELHVQGVAPIFSALVRSLAKQARRVTGDFAIVALPFGKMPQRDILRRKGAYVWKTAKTDSERDAIALWESHENPTIRASVA